MRVALFIDGKNFFAGWRDATGSAEIDFRKLAPWLVRAAGGATLLGAHYYTGVDEAIPKTPAQEKLDGFLDMLADQSGFFVQRFTQKMRTQTCASCGQAQSFAREKEVDTTIVADMIRLAAVNGFDIAVLLSGDADLVAAVEGVRALGKKVLVASWGQSGLSSRLRRAAFDHIDLTAGLAEFARQGHGHAAPTATADPGAAWNVDPAEYDAIAFEEIAKAQTSMSNGYVGVHFFVTRWRSERLPEIPEIRRRTLDRLVAERKAELFLATDGIQAVRVLGAAPSTTAAPLSNDPAAYDDAMIEEIRRAQNTMPGGYIGAHFFVTKWRSTTLPELVDFRRQALDRVVAQGKAEVYLTADGIQAVRLKG